MSAVPVASATNRTVFDEARAFLESLASTEARLAATVVVFLGAVLVVAVLAPAIIRVLNALVRGRLVGGRLGTAVDVTGTYVPTTLGELFLRAVQLGVLVAAALSLLVVWGLLDVAGEGLRSLGLSVTLLGQIGATLVLVLVVFVGSDLLEDTIARFSQGADRVTEHQEEIMLRVGQLGILAVGIGGGLAVWNVRIQGLLVGAGFLGIVVGLAARQTLGSLIAGFVLMFARPFTIGDWVEIGDQQGIVTDITITNTRLENFDGEFIVLPNDQVNNSPITNRSKKGHLRIRVDVGVDYDADPDHAAAVAIEAINGVEAVEPAPPPQVVPKAFGDSAVVLELRFWIDRPTPPRKWRATAAVVTAVKSAFEEAGIKIPFPQRELAGRAETGGFRVQDRSGAPATPGEPDDAPDGA